MWRGRFAAVCLFLVLAAPQQAFALDEARVAAAAHGFMARTGAPGLQIGVLTPDATQIFSYGLASRETGARVDERTTFEIGSVSKTFTAALAAVAAERGRLAWSDPASRHVTELARSAFDAISLLQLATHTTGGLPLQLPDDVRTNADLMPFYRGWTPPTPPGSTRSYSNPGIGLLGLATARALQGEFTNLMRDELLRPLGLHDTRYEASEGERRREAQGYRRDGSPVRLAAAPLAPEAYGLRSTAADLLRFLAAHLDAADATTPLSHALAKTQEGQVRAGVMTQALIWEWFEPDASWADVIAANGDAMVLEINPVAPLAAPRQPPAGALVGKTGATNGFGAYLAFVPGRTLGLVLLANRNHSMADRLELARSVLAELGLPQARR